MAKSFGPQPTINFIPDQHKCRDISHIHYETLTLVYTQTSYCMANFVIGNFVGTKYFQTFPFASHLGPVSTIFDWVFSAQFFAHLKIHKGRKIQEIWQEVLGLVLDQRQPLLVVMEQWAKQIFIHASCFHIRHVQTLTQADMHKCR